MPYYVYIATNKRNTVLYAGITNNLQNGLCGTIPRGRIWGLGLKSPMQFMLTHSSARLEKFNMWWTDTKSCILCSYHIFLKRENIFISPMATGAVKKRKKKHPDAFWKQLARFSSVFASIPEAIVFIDTQEKVVLANPAVELLTGRVPADVIGASVAQVFALQCAKADASGIMHEAIEGWRAVEFPDECSIMHSNGSLIPIIATSTPLYEDDGTYAGIVLAIRNISKDIELKNQQYAFFSFSTHQIRQPLAYLRLGLESLLKRKEEINITHREMLGELLEAAIRCSRFVKEFLDVSRLEQGRIDLAMKEVDVRALIAEVSKELSNFAISKNISLRLFPSDPAETPHTTLKLAEYKIQGDEERLKDVFRNLIVNAISYNRPKGEVSVDASRVSADEAAGRAAILRGSGDFQSYFNMPPSAEKQSRVPFLIITVSDTGLGIPEHDQMSIFRTFFRAENVKKEGMQGTGLGLSIVKSIVERSGGRIGFESKEGIGTTFYLFFPLEQTQGK